MEVLRHLALSPSGFVFDPRSGATFTANPSALVLLEAMREGQGLGALVETLGQQFVAGRADLTRDVLEFVRQLKGAGQLPADFELGA